MNDKKETNEVSPLLHVCDMAESMARDGLCRDVNEPEKTLKAIASLRLALVECEVCHGQFGTHSGSGVCNGCVRELLRRVERMDAGPPMAIWMPCPDMSTYETNGGWTCHAKALGEWRSSHNNDRDMAVFMAGFWWGVARERARFADPAPDTESS